MRALAILAALSAIETMPSYRQGRNIRPYAAPEIPIEGVKIQKFSRAKMARKKRGRG